MIIGAFLQVLTAIAAIILSWLPTVTTIPHIAGYDIDAALVSGVGSFYAFVGYFWMFADLWYGFLVLMGYYTIKMVLKVFLGHRAVGHH